MGMMTTTRRERDRWCKGGRGAGPAAAIKREAATKAELDELQAKRRDVSEGGHLRDEPALRLSAATLQRSEHAVVAVD